MYLPRFRLDSQKTQSALRKDTIHDFKATVQTVFFSTVATTKCCMFTCLNQRNRIVERVDVGVIPTCILSIPTEINTQD